MPGEPEGEFEVTKLEAIETEDGTEKPSKIFDTGEDFNLEVSFEGSGANWNNMKALGPLGMSYHVQFYAEGMGPTVWNRNFGTKSGQLNPAEDKYVIRSDACNVNKGGIYRCGVMVTFRFDPPPPGGPGQPWYGWLGFAEDCVIQIHPLETA
jgi:hypothetical protein